ncbi:hypothetical protein [Actinacidiphila alni]|nr:hypothetical protein [Actinacidiphila alni]
MPLLLAVCAVLFGLFLMHGAPASAQGGCHGGPMGAMPTHAAPTADAAPAVMAHTAPPSAPGATTGTPKGGATVVVTPSGATCWATPVRERAPLTGWAQATLAVLPLLGAESGSLCAGSRRERWRGPPPGGRSLLLRVCVART